MPCVPLFEPQLRRDAEQLPRLPDEEVEVPVVALVGQVSQPDLDTGGDGGSEGCVVENGGWGRRMSTVRAIRWLVVGGVTLRSAPASR